MRDHVRENERMAEWLQRGSWDPPEELLEAAVAFARSHPHRVSPLARLGRFVMSSTHATPAPSEHPRHRAPVLALTAFATFAVVLVGVAWGSGVLDVRPGDRPGGVAVPPSGVPIPSPTPSSERLSGDIRTCEVVTPPATADYADPWAPPRGAVVVCDITWSDDRLDGLATLTYDADGPSRSELDTWGKISLDAADGRWEGYWRGTVGPFGYARVHDLAGVLMGPGSDGALRLRWSIDSGRDSVWLISTDWPIDGMLEAREVPPPNGTLLVSGSSSCADVETGTETEVDGVVHHRDVAIECSGVIASDPRLDGVTRTILNGDEQPDGSATLWGTEEITVDGAVRWSGPYEGTVAVADTTHHLEGTYVGHGPYAGLEYAWTTIGDPESGYVTSGVIRPAP